MPPGDSKFNADEQETSVPCARCNGRGRALVKKEAATNYSFVREKVACWLCVRGMTTATQNRHWRDAGAPFAKPTDWDERAGQK